MSVDFICCVHTQFLFLLTLSHSVPYLATTDTSIVAYQECCIITADIENARKYLFGPNQEKPFFQDLRQCPELTKLFSCSTQLSKKFQLLIKTKIPTHVEFSCFKSLRCCIYHANKCLNANNC